MRLLAHFTVIGTPAPQGSKTAVMWGDRPGLIEGGSTAGRKAHKAWRAAVKHVAEQVRDEQPHDGPLSLTIEFRRAMPKSRRKADKVRGWCWHKVKPDKDKLLRSTLDGLTDAELIVDDARVCRLEVVAVETTGAPGATITLHSLDTADDETPTPSSERMIEAAMIGVTNHFPTIHRRPIEDAS